MTALDNLTNRDSWLYETEDYDAGLPEVKEYGGDFSDVALAAAELAALRARVEELEAALGELHDKCESFFRDSGYPASFHSGIGNSTINKARIALRKIQQS